MSHIQATDGLGNRNTKRLLAVLRIAFLVQLWLKAQEKRDSRAEKKGVGQFL